MKREGSEGRRGNDVQGVAGGSYVIVGKIFVRCCDVTPLEFVEVDGS